MVGGMDQLVEVEADTALSFLQLLSGDRERARSEYLNLVRCVGQT